MRSYPSGVNNYRDSQILFLAKGLRSFCYGFLGIIFPVYLARSGWSVFGVGILMIGSMIASAVLVYCIPSTARRFGCRRTLLGLAVLTVFSSVFLLISGNPWLAAGAMILGQIASAEGDGGAFAALEQVKLSWLSAAGKLNLIYSAYHLTGYAAGALGAFCVTRLPHASQMFFLVFLTCGVLLSIIYFFLSPDTFTNASESSARIPAPVGRLSALFALDSFAGGFIALNLATFWLYERFGLSIETLGWVTLSAQVLAGVSFLFSEPLARWKGLRAAMVFGRLISDAALLIAACLPYPGLVVGLLLLRYGLSQSDVAARNTFLMLAVEDSQRERAAGLAASARLVAKALGTTLFSWTLSQLSFAAPLFIGSAIKLSYDAFLYKVSRGIPLRNE